MDNSIFYKDLPEDIRLQIESFEFLCTDLDGLTEQENKDLLADNMVDYRNTATQKIFMAKIFEKRTFEVFHLLLEKAPLNVALQEYVLERVKEVQKKLHINTGLHLHRICNYTAAIENPSCDGGGAACH